MTSELRLCAIREYNRPGVQLTLKELTAKEAYSMGVGMNGHRVELLYDTLWHKPIAETESYIFKIEEVLRTVESSAKPRDISGREIDIYTQKNELGLLTLCTQNFQLAFSEFLATKKAKAKCYKNDLFAKESNKIISSLDKLVNRIQAVRERLKMTIDLLEVLLPPKECIILDASPDAVRP